MFYYYSLIFIKHSLNFLWTFRSKQRQLQKYSGFLRIKTVRSYKFVISIVCTPAYDTITDPRTAYYRNTTSSNLDQGRLYIDMQIPVTKGCNNYSQRPSRNCRSY